jgi:hypothetical protein
VVLPVRDINPVRIPAWLVLGGWFGLFVRAASAPPRYPVHPSYR